MVVMVEASDVPTDLLQRMDPLGHMDLVSVVERPEGLAAWRSELVGQFQKKVQDVREDIWIIESEMAGGITATAVFFRDAVEESFAYLDGLRLDVRPIR